MGTGDDEADLQQKEAEQGAEVALRDFKTFLDGGPEIEFFVDDEEIGELEQSGGDESGDNEENGREDEYNSGDEADENGLGK